MWQCDKEEGGGDSNDAALNSEVGTACPGHDDRDSQDHHYDRTDKECHDTLTSTCHWEQTMGAPEDQRKTQNQETKDTTATVLPPSLREIQEHGQHAFLNTGGSQQVLPGFKRVAKMLARSFL